METLYIKEGKRYIKVGTRLDTDYMPDGLWLFKSGDGSRGFSNLSCRLSKLPPHTEVQDYLKAFLNKEVIVEAIRSLNKKGVVLLGQISLDDFAQALIDQIYLSQKRRSEQGDHK